MSPQMGHDPLGSIQKTLEHISRQNNIIIEMLSLYNDSRLLNVVKDVKKKTKELSSVIDGQSEPSPKTLEGESVMPSLLDDLIAAVAAEDTVIDSAVTFITGVPALVKSAVDAANAGNKTAADAMVADITAKTAAIKAALTANTPVNPVP